MGEEERRQEPGGGGQLVPVGEARSQRPTLVELRLEQVGDTLGAGGGGGGGARGLRRALHDCCPPQPTTLCR